MNVIVFVVGGIAVAEPTWNELSDSSGWTYSHDSSTTIGTVSVYTKEVAGLPCFQGRAFAEVSPSYLLDVATDIESATEWSSADVTEAKTLYRSAKYMDYYQYLDVPFFSDRYWFLRGYFEQEENSTIFRWERLGAGHPHQQFHRTIQEKYPSSVETTINVGAWVFTENRDNVEVRYYICTNPGGSVPTALQSIGTESALPNNLQDLIAEANRRSAN